MNDLQQRVVDWHTTRFPTAQRHQVFYKTGEEFGEVGKALNIAEADNDDVNSRAPMDVVEEAADVVICLMVLCGRYMQGDLLRAVQAKLTKMSTPGGGHRLSPEIAS